MATRRWPIAVWMLGVCVLVAGVAWAQPVAPEEPNRVVLTWQKFQEVLKEREQAGEPKITLPWEEVEDLLGVAVEGMEGPELSVTWQQFRALLEWSMAQKEPPKVELPAEFVVSSAEYEGVLRDEGGVFELGLSINVLREEGWKRIPVLPRTVAIQSAELPEGCYLNPGANGYEILTNGTGVIAVKLAFAVSVGEQAGAYNLNFDTVRASTSTMRLTVPEKDVKITVAGAQAVLPIETSAQETVVGASLPSGAPVRVTWERALKEVEKAPTRLYAVTNTLVAVGEGSLTCRERIELSILHTGIRSVSLSVPADVGVLEVSGAAVQDWRVADRALDVRFAHEVLGQTSVNVVYEYTGAGAEGVVAVPVVRVPEAAREKGYLGVVAMANVEIAAGEHAGATAIDVRELPPEILNMTSQPLLLAFRYLGKAPQIALGVKKHEDVHVLLTIADSAVMTVMQTADGRRITKIVYNIRNNRNQFLRVMLPKGEPEVWTATVAGKSVRPAVDAEGRVLIPLVRSAGAAELAAFPVEVIYVEKQSRLGDSGTMRIDLPQADVPLTHMMVHLYLPAEGSYKKGILAGTDFEGPLHWVEKFTAMRSVPSPRPDQVQPDVQAQELQQQFRQRMDDAARVKGVTPIHVDLPVRGKLFRFEKILVLDEPLWIGFRYSGWEED